MKWESLWKGLVSVDAHNQLTLSTRKWLKDVKATGDKLLEKAKKYDELEPRLEDLVDGFRDDKSLGTYELHLYEQIESIITSEKLSKEET